MPRSGLYLDDIGQRNQQRCLCSSLKSVSNEPSNKPINASLIEAGALPLAKSVQEKVMPLVGS